MENKSYTDHVKRRRPEWNEVAKKLFEAKEMKRYYAQLEKDLSDKLKKLSENRSSMSNEFVFTAVDLPGRVSYKDIPELKDVDMDQYRGIDIVSWRLKKI